MILIWYWVGIREGKIPENSTFVPAPKYKFFRGFSPKNPHNFSFPRPQSIPGLMNIYSLGLGK